jgi:hypothetical protein
MFNGRRFSTAALALLVAGGLAMWTGCSRDGGVLGPAIPGSDDGSELSASGPSPALEAKATSIVHNDGRLPATGLVTVGNLTFWPYTGTSFSGDRDNPVDLLFRGKADPLRIRAALLGLDGNRTAYGLPDAWPFNATWTDAIGGTVECGYSDGPVGWTGSVVQLMLGDYDPLRFHLRLYDTGVGDGAGGTWTVGTVEFEIKIPGTADHQVLSWEVAEQLVTVDMMRSGLLGGDAPVMPSGPINDSPWRTIPAVIYNGLPPELVAVIQGPATPVSDDVPIGNDGRATVFTLTGQAPLVPGTWTHMVSLEYDQVVPKPFCSSGPYDYILITGPITFTMTATLDARGGYRVSNDYVGELVATPLDVTQRPPAPAGTPYTARVSGKGIGRIDAAGASVWAIDKKLSHSDGGAEMLFQWLNLTPQGEKQFTSLTQCLGE